MILFYPDGEGGYKQCTSKNRDIYCISGCMIYRRSGHKSLASSIGGHRWKDVKGYPDGDVLRCVVVDQPPNLSYQFNLFLNCILICTFLNEILGPLFYCRQKDDTLNCPKSTHESSCGVTAAQD